MVCDVCDKVFAADMNTTNDENSIVECVQCKVRVHQFCYGVENCSTSWLCNFCEENSSTQQTKKCVLCPNTEGALKKTTCKNWGACYLCTFYDQCGY